MLAEAFGRKISEPMIDAYTVGLQGLADEQIKTAAATALQSSRFMPSPAELRELAGVLRTSDRAEKAWLSFHEAICEHGPYHSICFDDVVINAVVRGLGGWQAACEVEGAEFESFYRQKFLKAYEALARAGVGIEQAAPLLGLFDAENQRNGFATKPPKLIATGLKPLPNAPRIGSVGAAGGKAIAAFEVPRLKSPSEAK